MATGRPYPERAEHRPGAHDMVAELVIAKLVRPLRRMVVDPARSLRPIVTRAVRLAAGNLAEDSAPSGDPQRILAAALAAEQGS